MSVSLEGLRRVGMFAAVVAAPLSVAAGGGAAATPTNRPISFSSLRTENFSSEIYSVGADGSGRVNLTQNPAPDDRFAVSPDGTKIAFVSGRDGYSAIYVMNSDGSDPRRVCTPRVNTRVDTCVDSKPLPGSRLGGLVWSPTGQMIAFKVDRGAVVVHHGTKVMGLDAYSLDLETGRAQFLGTGDWYELLAFSPDGRLIVHGRVVSRADTGAVVRRLSGTCDPTRTDYLLPTVSTCNPFDHRSYALPKVPTDGAEYRYYNGAAWSPSGKALAFWVWRGGGGLGMNASLYLVDKTSRRGYRELKTVTGDVRTEAVAWSPNGVWLALSIDFGGNQRTYLVRADGHGSATVEAGTQRPPLWSPDSRYLALLVGAGNGSRAVVVAPPSTAAQTVTSPALDPDVSQIAWAGDRLVFASSTPSPPAAAG